MEDRASTSYRVPLRRALVGAFLLTVMMIGQRARADAFHDYALRSSFALPVGTSVFDALSDGRMIAIVGDTLHVETAVGSRQFQVLGSLPNADFPSFGAAFLKVSPDGLRIAVGNNGGASFGNFLVGVFDLSNLAGDWFEASHFLGAWVDDRDFAITAGDFGQPAVVTILDTQSPDPANPTNPMVVNNIGGASAGVGVDAAGNLYTGNGFTIGGPSGTGAVKAFFEADWKNALSSGIPLNFETEGVLIIDILSADGLGFDGEGNLFVGGGDGAAQSDFAAIVNFGAVAAALAGQGAVDPDDAALVRRLDPDDVNNSNFYVVSYNPLVMEFYVRDFGGAIAYVYSPNQVAVPTMSAWGLVCLTLGIAVMATLLLRRGPIVGGICAVIPCRTVQGLSQGGSHA